MEQHSIPILGEVKYTLETVVLPHQKRIKQPRVMIEKTDVGWMLRLTLQDWVDAETTLKLQKVAANIYLKCIERGIPGRLYGHFSTEYYAITMTHRGKVFCRTIDVAAYERDHPVAKPEEVSLISKPTLGEVMHTRQK